MSEPRDPKHADGTFFTGVMTGGAIGMFIGAALMAMGGYNYMKQRSASAYNNLVPVVVATEGIAAHTPVTFDLITQRSVPEHFVTSSFVKPDSVNHIINQRINVSVQAGDPLFWNQFEDKKLRKQAPCLVAARDLPAGSKLTEEDLVNREMPTDLATASFIRQSERPQILGQLVRTAFRKGDPILWTHFQQGPPPAAGVPQK